MATLFIKKHLQALCSNVEIDEEEFVEIISNRFESIEKRQIKGWLEGKRAQKKTVEGLCRAISKLSGTGHEDGIERITPGIWPKELEFIELDWFSLSIQRFSKSCGFENSNNNLISSITGYSIPDSLDLDAIKHDNIDNFYFTFRKIRSGSSNSLSVAIELLYIGTHNGSGLISNSITRLGQHHKGVSLVSPHNIYSMLFRGDNNSSEQFSVRFLNFNKPIRGNNSIIGGFLQRSTNSNSDPASYVVMAVKVKNLSIFNRIEKSLKKILKEVILSEDYISDICLSSFGIDYVKIIDEHSDKHQCNDILSRLEKITNFDDIGRDIKKSHLSFKTMSPEFVVNQWSDFDMS